MTDIYVDCFRDNFICIIFPLKIYFVFSDDIRGLENKLELLEHRMNEVKNLTSIAATKSTAVSQEAIDLLILDLALPPVDIEQLRNQVEDVNNEVKLNCNKYYYYEK